MRTSPEWLYQWFRWSGDARRIRAGSYAVEAGATPRTLLETMVQGLELLETVRLPEGATLRQWTDYPIVGSGFGTFRYVFQRYAPVGGRGVVLQAHNDYLEVGAELHVHRGRARLGEGLVQRRHGDRPTIVNPTRARGASERQRSNGGAFSPAALLV